MVDREPHNFQNGEEAERQVVEIITKGKDKDETEAEITARLNKIKDKVQKPAITIALVLFVILNLVMLIVGAINVNNCPLNKMIPIYLIVAGAGGILTKVLSLLNKRWEVKALDVVLSFLFFAEFVWMILGSYWIYSEYQPDYFPEQLRYCDKTTYLLAFWLLTIHYIMLALVIAVVLLLLLCTCSACCACLLCCENCCDE